MKLHLTLFDRAIFRQFYESNILTNKKVQIDGKPVLPLGRNYINNDWNIA